MKVKRNRTEIRSFMAAIAVLEYGKCFGRMTDFMNTKYNCKIK